MAGGLNTIANLLGRVDANNALVVAFDSTVPVTATRFLGDDGTAALPTFSFSGTGDGDNGMYLSAADTLGWSAGGTLRLSLSSTAVTSTVPYVAPNGSASALAYGFSAESGMGMYRLNSQVAFAIGGLYVGEFNGAGFGFASNTGLVWRDSTGGSGSVDVSLSRGAANLLSLAAGDSYGFAAPLFTNTAPTIASGFGTSPSIVNSNGTGAWTVNVGTGGVASSGVITMPAATTGWVVDCVDITNAASFVTVQTAGTTTSVTLTNYSRTTGLAVAWTASDILRCKATAY